MKPIKHYHLDTWYSGYKIDPAGIGLLWINLVMYYDLNTIHGGRVFWSWSQPGCQPQKVGYLNVSGNLESIIGVTTVL